MSYIFIIMQIANKELDKVYEDVIVPAIIECGFEAKRVDKHNKGGLLKSEIIEFIQGSTLIIADLTNERPNCYLEIGYAMGLDKFKNLILTVREDHFNDSLNYKKGGPKIHFDLSGYDILGWEKGKELEFKKELIKRIKRRLTIINEPLKQKKEIWDKQWLQEQEAIAKKGLENSGFVGGMEIKFTLQNEQLSVSQRKLDEAARSSEIYTFGWPIGFYDTSSDYRPKPRTDGIYTEISNKTVHNSYDYWAIKKNGIFYSLISLFEDSKTSNIIYVETRIWRVTEALFYCARLYSRLNIEPTQEVYFSINHFGLKDRKLAYAGDTSAIWFNNVCNEEKSETEIHFKLSDIESKIVELVKEILSPMFMLFNFYEVGDDRYEHLVNKFISGKL